MNLNSLMKLCAKNKNRLLFKMLA